MCVIYFEEICITFKLLFVTVDVFIVCGRYVELCDKHRGIFMAVLTVPFMRYDYFYISSVWCLVVLSYIYLVHSFLDESVAKLMVTRFISSLPPVSV